MGRRLSRQTGAALSRLTLLQAASTAAGPRPAGALQGPQWLFEIPLTTPQGAAVAQFEVRREQAAAAAGDGEPVWRARFSLDLEPMGAVHARVSLSGARARVSLWAEKGETADRLAAQRGDLAQALGEDDLVAQVAVFPGAPDAAPPGAGRFLDKAV